MGIPREAKDASHGGVLLYAEKMFFHYGYNARYSTATENKKETLKRKERMIQWCGIEEKERGVITAKHTGKRNGKLRDKLWYS